ncbi:MAG: Curli production assembly/transport component CsgG [Gemmatimonadetes bacterium]|nr:Curli production assembly/transport component CsgG [Gemmatimonadota bacterium]
MTRFARSVSLAAAVVGLAAPLPVFAQASSGKPTVAVIQFTNGAFGKDSHDYDGLAKGIPDFLITDLSANSNIRVLERTAVQSLVDEQKLVTGGQVDKETAVKVGKLLGVHHMIIGVYMTDGKGNFRVDARAVSVETGQIEYTDRVDDKADNIMTAIGTLANKLNAGMKLPPMPVRRTGDASVPGAGTPSTTGAAATQAGAAATTKLPMRVAIMYGKALDLADKHDKAKAVELFGAVLKEFPEYSPARSEIAKLNKT